MKWRNAKFAMIPMVVMQHSSVRGNAGRIAVYAGVQAVGWEQPDKSWRSVRSLATATADMIGLGDEACRKHLSELIKAGLIAIDEADGSIGVPGLGISVGNQIPTSAQVWVPGYPNDDGTPSSTRETKEEKPPATDVADRTPAQEAQRVLDDYWRFVKERSQRHPIGITPIAFKKLITPFLEAGVKTKDLKYALSEMYVHGATLTRQGIERQLDGRVGKRSGPSTMDKLREARFDEATGALLI